MLTFRKKLENILSNYHFKTISQNKAVNDIISLIKKDLLDREEDIIYSDPMLAIGEENEKELILKKLDK